MKAVLLKEKEATVQSALVSHPRLWRIVPMGIASVPLLMRMLLVLTNGTRFMCTKSPTASTHIDGNRA